MEKTWKTYLLSQYLYQYPKSVFIKNLHSYQDSKSVDMDKVEEKKMIKKRLFTKTTWYD